MTQRGGIKIFVIMYGTSNEAHLCNCSVVDAMLLIVKVDSVCNSVHTYVNSEGE